VDLAGRYRSLLTHFESDPDDAEELAPGEFYMYAPSVDLRTLLREEEGVHLYYPSHRSGVPIELRLLSMPERKSPAEFAKLDVEARARALQVFEQGEGGEAPPAPARIVRLYCPPGSGSAGTVTDLATGQMLPYVVPTATLFLWAYAGLPESDRIIFGE
jgi:hypothetical protein